MAQKALAAVLSAAVWMSAATPLVSVADESDYTSVLDQAPPVPNVSKFSTASWDAGWYRMETDLQRGTSIYSFDYNTTGQEIQTENPDDYRLVSLPEYLIGSDYIITRRAQRRDVFFMAEQDIVVYAAIDTAYGNSFSWETGWSQTTDTLTTQDGTTYALYSKTYTAHTQVRIKKLGSDTDAARNFFLMILPVKGETISKALTHYAVLPEGERNPAHDINRDYRYYIQDVYNQEEGEELPTGYTASGDDNGNRTALSAVDYPAMEQGDLSQNATYTAENVKVTGSPIDNRADTYWESNGFPGSVTIDLGGTKAVNRLVLKIKEDWDDRTQTIEVKGSTDGREYTTLAAATEYAFQKDKGNTVSIVLSTVVVRYIQIVVTANTGSAGGQISEIEVYGPDRSRTQLEAGVNLARNCPFTVSSDRYNGGSPVDGDPTTYWRSNDIKNESAESLTVDLQHVLTVNRVALRLWPRWGDRVQRLELQGSEDGTAYTTLVPAADYSFTQWNNAVEIAFEDAAIRYIRVVGTSNTGDSGIQVGELEVYGPAQTVIYTGNRTLELIKTAVGEQPLKLARALETPVAGNVILETRIWSDTANANSGLLTAGNADGEPLLSLCQNETGMVQAATASGKRDLTEWEAETWHTVKLVLDLDAGKGEVWMDHLRKAEELAFTPGELSFVEYAIESSSIAHLQIDYLKVYDNTVRYVAEDSFDALTTGARPSDWQVGNTGHAAVAEIPFPADKSLQLTSTGEAAQVTRIFAPISGDVTVEVKVRPMTDGWITAPLITDEQGHVTAKIAFYHNSLFVSNGNNWAYLCSGDMPHNYYEAGNWFYLKLVMNTDTRRYDVYVDGAKRYAGASFVQEVASISQVHFRCEQAGDIYIDQLKIYDSASLTRGLMPTGQVFNVREFGAKGDGKTDDTQAIAKAVKAAAGTGGTVLLENGVFYTGQITLQSDMTLFIAPSATIYANIDRHAYDKVIPSNGYNGNRQLGRGIIYFQKAKNVRITGGGTIFGNGFYAYGENDPPDQRPCMLYFAQCEDIVIEDLHLVQSPFWTVVPYESQQVTIRRVNITNHTAPNRDGIDPVNSQNMTIEDCCIYAGDDAICPKSGNRIPMAHIDVRRCLLQSDCNGIKIGTDTQGPISDLSFEDICLKKVGLSGMTVQSVDGSDIENIRFKRIDMNDVDNALFVCIGNRYRMPIPNPGYSKRLGNIRDLRFEDIRFTNPMDHPYSQHASDNIHEAMVIGLNPAYNTIDDGLTHHVEDILFKNVYLEMPGGATTVPAWTEGISNGYPEHQSLKTSTGWAYTLRWADNVRFVNCQSVAAKADVRQEIAWTDGSEAPAQAALRVWIEEVQAVQQNPSYDTAPSTLRESLEASLAAANTIYEDNNAAALDSERAAAALQAALTDLETVITVDKTALQAAVEQAKTDLNPYTETSAEAYRQALAAAKDVLDDTKATQTQVNHALKALKTAEMELEVNDPATVMLTFSQIDGMHTRLLYGTMFYTDWKTGDNAPGNMAGTAANGANKNMALQATVTLTPLHDGIDLTTAWKRIGFRLRSSWVDGQEKTAQFYYLTSADVTMDENHSFKVTIPLPAIETGSINWEDVRDLNVICELNDPYRLTATQDSPDITLTLTGVRIAALEKELPDTTVLRAAIAQAQQVNQRLYTTESVQTMLAALQKATDILQKDVVTQEEIQEATLLLQEALNRLQIKPIQYGNVDEDANGDITAADALLTLQAATGKVSLSDRQQAAADVDGTPGVTAADALCILQRATQKISRFPIEI